MQYTSSHSHVQHYFLLSYFTSEFYTVLLFTKGLGYMVVWYIGQVARCRLVRYVMVGCVAVCCGTFEYSTVCDLGQCGVERYGMVQ